MPLVIKIIAYFPLNYDENLKKKLENSNCITFFRFLASILDFTYISWLQTNENPDGREQKTWKNRTMKKSKKFGTKFVRKIVPCPLCRKKIKGINYEPLPVIPAYTLLRKKLKIFLKKQIQRNNIISEIWKNMLFIQNKDKICLV